MHTLILGRSNSGKSYYSKQLAIELANQSGRKIFAYNPLNEREWHEIADYQETDIKGFERFLDVCFTAGNENAYIFVEECGDILGRYSDHDKIATQSRHKGHKVFFIVQSFKSLKPVLRDQCSNVVIFNSSPKVCKEAAEQFNCEILEKARDLPQGHCYIKSGMSPVIYVDHNGIEKQI